jgi:hypothetical protein
MSFNRCSGHTGRVDPELMNHFLNNGNSSSELECKLKLSFETIFDNNKNPLEKIGKLFNIAFNPLPLGACGGEVEPLAEGYLLLNQQEFFNSRIYDVKQSEPLKRTDIKFTNIVPLAYVSCEDDHIEKDNIIGYITGDGLGIDVPQQKNLRIWKVNSQITLDRSKLFNVKQDEYYLKNLVTVRPFLNSTVFDSSNKNYINCNINTVQTGSDGLFYYARELPGPEYDEDSKLLKDNNLFDKYFVYKLEVYDKKSDAMNAVIQGETKNKKIADGSVKLLKLTK